MPFSSTEASKQVREGIWQKAEQHDVKIRKIKRQKQLWDTLEKRKKKKNKYENYR